MDITITGYVRGGRLVARQWATLLAAIAKMRNGEVTITVTRKHATRSLASNSLYWAVYVRRLSEHTGFTPDEMHEVLKAKFLPKHLAVANGNGEVVGEFVVGGSTTKLNGLEFSEYLKEVKTWAASLGVELPEADPNWREHAREAA